MQGQVTLGQRVHDSGPQVLRPGIRCRPAADLPSDKPVRTDVDNLGDG